MAQTTQTRAPDGSLRVDIHLWVNKTTLDIIGHAGNSASMTTMPLEVKMLNFTRL